MAINQEIEFALSKGFDEEGEKEIIDKKKLIQNSIINIFENSEITLDTTLYNGSPSPSLADSCSIASISSISSFSNFSQQFDSMTSLSNFPQQFDNITHHLNTSPLVRNNSYSNSHTNNENQSNIIEFPKLGHSRSMNSIFE